MNCKSGDSSLSVNPVVYKFDNKENNLKQPTSSLFNNGINGKIEILSNNIVKNKIFDNGNSSKILINKNYSSNNYLKNNITVNKNNLSNSSVKSSFITNKNNLSNSSNKSSFIANKNSLSNSLVKNNVIANKNNSSNASVKSNFIIDKNSKKNSDKENCNLFEFSLKKPTCDIVISKNLSIEENKFNKSVNPIKIKCITNIFNRIELFKKSEVNTKLKYVLPTHFHYTETFEENLAEISRLSNSTLNVKAKTNNLIRGNSKVTIEEKKKINEKIFTKKNKMLADYSHIGAKYLHTFVSRDIVEEDARFMNNSIVTNNKFSVIKGEEIRIYQMHENEIKNKRTVISLNDDEESRYNKQRKLTKNHIINDEQNNNFKPIIYPVSGTHMLKLRGGEAHELINNFINQSGNTINENLINFYESKKRS